MKSGKSFEDSFQVNGTTSTMQSKGLGDGILVITRDSERETKW
jgi:hypothetical protein